MTKAMPTKAPANATKVTLNPPGPARQVQFYQLLVAARKQWFMDALSEALAQVPQKIVKEQIGKYVPQDAQRVLAAAGLRDEFVFPVPAVLEQKPSLVGYYRLLLGAPQKSFYKGATGMGRFKGMEESDIITEGQKTHLPEFCRAMAKSLAGLVAQIPKISGRDVRELPLLTYGSQLQGSNNTLIGKKAMRDVFLVIAEIVKRFVVEKTESRLKVRNSAGRTVLISLSHDPDVSIQESMGERVHHKVAIEVKGGTDVSNAHNRAGEAEKSHQKARNSGFPEFWTVIFKRGLDLRKLQSESPTTNHWFDITEVLARNGRDWEDFRQRLAGMVGIPLRT
ncbi:MAG: XcyI family restriction endonuclease [Terriglobales bacterium]